MTENNKQHMNNEIKILSFDADNTLWDFKKAMRFALSKILEAIQEIDPEASKKLTVEKMIAIRDAVAENLRGIEPNLTKIRLASFQQTLEVIKRPNEELAKYLHELYMKYRFERIELFNDVLPTLNELKKKYTIGIISNGNTYPERIGHEKLFDFVFFAQDYGYEKPDPMIFSIALEKIGCKNTELLHIGDSLKSDVLGANNAEIKSVWLNRTKEKNETEIIPDFEITSLLDLLDILL